jgi:hypothetical protein
MFAIFKKRVILALSQTQTLKSVLNHNIGRITTLRSVVYDLILGGGLEELRE